MFPGFAKPHPGLYYIALPGLGIDGFEGSTRNYQALEGLEGHRSKAQGEALRTLGTGCGSAALWLRGSMNATASDSIEDSPPLRIC